MVMLEDTHAHRMGMPLGLDYVRDVATWAHGHGLAVHVDGARIVNAAAAAGTSVAALLGPADSGSLCLSKGLGCPAGSVVVGSRDMIERARRARKALGGGQRQVGILAAAGLVALEPGSDGMLERLADDHRRARVLAEACAELPGVRLDPDLVRTNIVILELDGREPDVILARAAAQGVRLMRYPGQRLRAVTHADIADADVTHAIDVLRRVFREP
jgi:threonine aldolase